MFAGRVGGETALYLGGLGASLVGGVWLSHIRWLSHVCISGPGIAR